MANIVFNIAKGRIVEFYNRVKAADPANARFVLTPLETSGLESDATLIDKDDFSQVVAGTTNEQTTMGKKYLVAADLAALPAPDDAGDKYSLDLPDVTWTAATGNAISKLCLGYATVVGPTDAQITPLALYDFVATPDGTDIVATTTEFFRAT
jgi:hypothetical protein